MFNPLYTEWENKVLYNGKYLKILSYLFDNNASVIIKDIDLINKKSALRSGNSISGNLLWFPAFFRCYPEHRVVRCCCLPNPSLFFITIREKLLNICHMLKLRITTKRQENTLRLCEWQTEMLRKFLATCLNMWLDACIPRNTMEVKIQIYALKKIMCPWNEKWKRKRVKGNKVKHAVK